MKRYFSLYILALLLWLISCTSSKPDRSNSLPLLYEKDTIVAWNEDTVLSYLLALTKQKNFYYTIIKRDSSKKVEEYYKGLFRFSKDTFFLTYNKGLRPKEVTTYLIKEASGNYLIQPLTNSNKRMFLRIQRLGHGL